VLDILQALSYKLENLRNKIRRVEQLEPIPSTMTNTRIVAAIIQMQIDIASLFDGQSPQPEDQTPAEQSNVEKFAPTSTTNIIDLTNPHIIYDTDHHMTLDTDQPTSSGKVLTLPTPKPLPMTKGKEPMGKKQVTTPADT
jgi:hypothetical protein